MQKVAILLTSYNRREAALSCLRNLYSQADAMKGEEKYDFSVYLVDDGSTDGTSDDVAEIFPGVKIIRTDGGLLESGHEACLGGGVEG
jgi:GT2 family glycosyltransferase